MNYLKLIAGILICMLAAAGIGYYYGTQQVEVQIQEKLVEVQGEERVVYKDRIVTVIRETKPDGTVTETTKTEDREGIKDSRTSTTSKDKSTSKTVAVSTGYRVGASYLVSYKDLLDQDLERAHLSMSRRLLGPVWLDTQVGTRSTMLGISWEF